MQGPGHRPSRTSKVLDEAVVARVGDGDGDGDGDDDDDDDAGAFFGNVVEEVLIGRTAGRRTGHPPTSETTTTSATTAAPRAMPHFVTVRGHSVRFQENWGAGIGGGLWSTGLAMAQYLNTNHALEAFSKLWKEPRQRSPTLGTVAPPGGLLRVLELGSGNGLLAACWLALARSIASTEPNDEDYDTDDRSRRMPDASNVPPLNDDDYRHELFVTDTNDHLALIRKTLEANSHLVHLGTVHVLEYEWGGPWHVGGPSPAAIVGDTDTDAATLPLDLPTHPNDSLPPLPSSGDPAAAAAAAAAFDVIFGSDVAYHPDLYDPLIASLRLLSDAHTRIYLGVTMADTTPEFFHRLTTEGFVYRKLDDDLLEPEYRGMTFGIFVVHRHVPWFVPLERGTERAVR